MRTLIGLIAVLTCLTGCAVAPETEHIAEDVQGINSGPAAATWQACSLIGCDDRNDCTDDWCTTGGCVHDLLPAGTVCSHAGCVGACSEAVITPDGAVHPGECQCAVALSYDSATSADLGLPGLCQLMCDDGIECTADSCSPTGGCTHEPLPGGTACHSDKWDCDGACYPPYMTPMGFTFAGECGCNSNLRRAASESSLIQSCAFLQPGAPCVKDGITGKCQSSTVCCTGCIDALGFCRTGSADSYCGYNGLACESCETVGHCIGGQCHPLCDVDAECDDGNPCTSDACDDVCVHVEVQPGTTCGAGMTCQAIAGQHGLVCYP